MEGVKKKKKHSTGSSRRQSTSSEVPVVLNTFALNYRQWYADFPELATISIDLVQLMMGFTAPDEILEPFFYTLLGNFEKALACGMAIFQLQNQNPELVHKRCDFLEHQLRNFSLFACLHGFWKGNYANQLRYCLVALVKHYINASLMIVTPGSEMGPNNFQNHQMNNLHKEAAKIYRFIKFVFAGSSIRTAAESLLDTFLLSELCVPGHKNKGLHGCLLEELVRDIRSPAFLTSSGTALLKFMVPFKIYVLENSNSLKRMDANTPETRLIDQTTAFLKELPLNTFDDMETAARLWKGFGKKDIRTLYEKMNLSRIIGIVRDVVSQVLQDVTSPNLEEQHKKVSKKKERKPVILDMYDPGPIVPLINGQIYSLSESCDEEETETDTMDLPETETDTDADADQQQQQDEEVVEEIADIEEDSNQLQISQDDVEEPQSLVDQAMKLSEIQLDNQSEASEDQLGRQSETSEDQQVGFIQADTSGEQEDDNDGPKTTSSVASDMKSLGSESVEVLDGSQIEFDSSEFGCYSGSLSIDNISNTLGDTVPDDFYQYVEGEVPVVHVLVDLPRFEVVAETGQNGPGFYNDQEEATADDVLEESDDDLAIVYDGDGANSTVTSTDTPAGGEDEIDEAKADPEEIAMIQPIAEKQKMRRKCRLEKDPLNPRLSSSSSSSDEESAGGA